jgi:hypothetical protein
MGIKLEKNDWIAGFAPANDGNKLLYAMEVEEVLDLDDYYKDRRFKKKT